MLRHEVCTCSTNTLQSQQELSTEEKHSVLNTGYLSSSILQYWVLVSFVHKTKRHDNDSCLLGHNICMWLHISQTVWRNVSPSSSRVGSSGHKQYFLLWRGYGGCDAHPSILWNCRKCGVPRGCFRLGSQLHLSGSWIKQDGVCYLAFAEMLWTLIPWRWRRQEPVIQQCSITFK